SRATSGVVPITLTVGSNQVEAEYTAGSAARGTASLQPQVVEKPSGPSFLRKNTGLMIGLALLAVAASAGAYALGDTFLGKENALQSTLQPYSQGFVASDEYDEDDLGDGRGAQMATTPILQRAVEATGQLAERQGLLTKVEALLERANLALRPAEAIFFYAVGVAVLVLLAVVLIQNPVGALVVGVIGALIPPAVLSFLAGR